MQPDAGDVSSVDAMDETPVDFERSAELPARLRLLCIGPQQPSWVNLTLQLDFEGCHEPKFLWVSTQREAMSALRDDSFDCVLISAHSVAKGLAEIIESVAEFDAVSLVKTIRASGYDDPLILIAAHLDDVSWKDACRQNCEVLITANRWESLALVPVIKRSIERVDLLRDNHRLAVGNHRRLVRERDEAEHLLGQQRRILSDLQRLSEVETADGDGEVLTARVQQFELPAWKQLSREIEEYYHELLRTYVIMGSGSLGVEIAQVAELIAVAGLTPSEGLQMHLERVEALVRGLGNRSARHVMARADLMALELMMRLGECYQSRIEASPARSTDSVDPGSLEQL